MMRRLWIRERIIKKKEEEILIIFILVVVVILCCNIQREIYEAELRLIFIWGIHILKLLNFVRTFQKYIYI